MLPRGLGGAVVLDLLRRRVTFILGRSERSKCGGGEGSWRAGSGPGHRRVPLQYSKLPYCSGVSAFEYGSRATKCHHRLGWTPPCHRSVPSVQAVPRAGTKESSACRLDWGVVTHSVSVYCESGSPTPELPPQSAKCKTRVLQPVATHVMSRVRHSNAGMLLSLSLVNVSSSACVRRNVTQMDFCATWDITRTVDYITNNAFQRVALQFPDELLNDAPAVATELKLRLHGTSAKVPGASALL
jgi:hypothetical protein